MTKKSVDEGALLIGLSDGQYNELEGIRATEIKAGARSMKAMRHVSLGNNFKPTEAMAFGSLMHSVLANPAALDDAVVFEGIRRGKSWEAFQKKHLNAGVLILKPKELTLLKLQVANIRNHSAAKSVIDRVKEVEVSARWKDPVYGYGKCRFDGLGDGLFVDYKTSSIIDTDNFMSRAETLGYLLQFAWYSHGYKKVASEYFGELKHAFCVCIQTTGEFDIVVYELSVELMREVYERIGGDDESRRNRGAEQIAREFAICKKLDVFQGLGTEILQWKQPSWAQALGKTNLIIDGKKMEV